MKPWPFESLAGATSPAAVRQFGAGRVLAARSPQKLRKPPLGLTPPPSHAGRADKSHLLYLFPYEDSTQQTQGTEGTTGRMPTLLQRVMR